MAAFRPVRYTIYSAEEIIEEVQRVAGALNVDSSNNKPWEDYIEHIHSFFTDPESIDQLESLFEFTKGMYLSSNKNDRKVFSFALAVVRDSLEAIRHRSVLTEEISVSFPEMHPERYIQLYRAVISIREPFSHEEINIVYKNRDGSVFMINTAVNTISWTEINGGLFVRKNISEGRVCLYLEKFIQGKYEILGRYKWDNISK